MLTGLIQPRKFAFRRFRCKNKSSCQTKIYHHLILLSEKAIIFTDNDEMGIVMFSDKVKTLPEVTADRIIEYIIENRLEPDDRIPNETELGQILNVGRSTVREAVRLLVSRNVLVIRRGAGTYIAQNTGISEDPLGLIFSADRYKLAKDLLEVRIILEPEIAAMAANRATEKNIAEIWKYCHMTEDKIDKGEDHMPPDVLFHKAIAKSSGNDVIEKIIPIIDTSVAVFVNITYGKLKEETRTTHRLIAEAIGRHDATGAKHAMMMHMLYNKYEIEAVIEKHNNGKEFKFNAII